MLISRSGPVLCGPSHSVHRQSQGACQEAPHALFRDECAHRAQGEHVYGNECHTSLSFTRESSETRQVLHSFAVCGTV